MTQRILIILFFVLLNCMPVSAQDFLRGDADGDGIVDGLADSVYILKALFSPPFPTLYCEDAADATDDGSINIADVILLMTTLYTDSSFFVSAPGTTICGSDPTADGFTCGSYNCGPYVPPAPDINFILSASDLTGDIGETVTASVQLNIQSTGTVAGLAFGLCSDSNFIEVNSTAMGAGVLFMDSGNGPDFFKAEAEPEGVKFAMLTSFLLSETLAPGATYEVVTIDYSLVNNGNTLLSFCEGIGDPPIQLSVACVDIVGRIIPNTIPGLVSIGGVATPPANEQCQNAIEAVNGSQNFSLINAVTDGPDLAGFCDIGPGGDDIVHLDVWYTYTATCAGDLVISTAGSNLDTRLAVYSSTACPANAADVIACDDDSLIFPPGESSLTISVVMGQTILIQVGTFSESTPTGVGTLNISCQGTVLPVNDDCADASSILGSTSFNLTSATTDGPDLSGFCDMGAGDDQIYQDVWFCYVTPCDGDLTISITSSSVDTRLAVYADCSCPTSGSNLVACDDDVLGSPPGEPSVTFPVLAGESYLIQVGTFDATTPTGSGLLNITCQKLVITGDFIRGDSNGDNQLDIGDPIHSLSALFVLNKPPPSCIDSGDTNDDGVFNIADPVQSLSYLFVPGAPEPPSPFPACGGDSTMDNLSCEAYSCP